MPTDGAQVNLEGTHSLYEPEEVSIGLCQPLLKEVFTESGIVNSYSAIQIYKCHISMLYCMKIIKWFSVKYRVELLK